MRNISFTQLLVLICFGLLLFSDITKLKKYVLNFFKKLKTFNVKKKK
jgi:hypothetical protein